MAKSVECSPRPGMQIFASAGTWEFPKLRDTLFRGPYSKAPTI